MNKRTMKRWVGKVTARAVAFTVAMSAAFSMSTCNLMAASEDLIDTGAAGSLSIYKYDITAAEQAGVTIAYDADGSRNQEAEQALAAYGLAGVEFSAIKVSDILTESESGHIRLVYEVEEDLKDTLGLDDNAKGVYSGQELNQAMAQLLENEVNGKNALEGLLEGRKDTLVLKTDANGQAKAADLELGMYLVVETKVPANVSDTTAPFLVSVPSTDASGERWFYDVSVYPKNQTNDPTIDKEVRNQMDFADTTTASGGDTVTYRIISRVPEVTSSASYLTGFDFKDTLAEGLLYGEDLKIAFYADKASAASKTAAAASWNEADHCYSVKVSGQNISVTMTDKGLSQLNHTYKNQYMVLEYTAAVKATEKLVLGDNGNVNEASLIYKRTNQDHSVTIHDRAEVYSYGLELAVKYADQKGSVRDMAFVLQNADGKYIVVEQENGIYYMTGTTDQKEKAGTLIPDASGTLHLYGFEAGTYELTQTKTGKGYTLMTKKAEIVIEGTETQIEPSQAPITGKINEHAEVIRTLMDPADATVDASKVSMLTLNDSENAVVPLELVNSKTPLLPKTGGEGMLFLVLFGAVILVIGMSLSQRKRNEV